MSVRSSRLVTASASAMALALACSGTYACSSNDKPDAAGSSSSSGGGGGLDASKDNEVAATDGGDGASTSDASSTLPLGTIPTIDEPDVPCVTPKGVKTVLFAGGVGTSGPPVSVVQALGARRFATGLGTNGFITYDALGTTPKRFTLMLGATQTAFSSEGTTIGAMAASPGKIDYQRYDDQGVASGAIVAVATGIATGPSRVWIASGGGGSLVVWPSGDTLFAAGITAGGALAGPPFTLATSAPNPKVAITYSGDKYAVVYSYATTTGTAAAARFVYASTTALMGTPVDIGTADALEPVAITPTSAGFVMVVDAGGDEHIYIVPLDPTGKLSGPAHRLLGGDLPWGLASHGGDAALVSLTNDVKVGTAEGPRAPQLRPLDITGKPTGPWVCLDAKIPAGLEQDMGIVAEPSGGYAVTYKSPADATVLIRTDKLGSGAPL
jgi:hypothetical protein